MTAEFEIILVPPAIWQPELEEVLQELSPNHRRQTLAILRTMHNRHIGITPRQAVGLAYLVSDTGGTRLNLGIWGVVMERLQQEVSCRHQAYGILPGSLPPYTLLRLAGPVLEEAGRRIGLCCLFCGEPIQNDSTLDDYRNYARHLDAELKRMAESQDEYYRLFWADRAMTMSAYSRGAFQWETPATGLPETDPASLGLLLRLKPDVQRTRPLSRHPRSMTQPLKHREIRRLKEGGFSGIHHTRRQEDMGDIMLSEFINPPAVLADRLINNGFLALRRQPRREMLRDVLVVGMMPHEVQPKLSVDFIKACWLDFVGRFSMKLIESRRIHSEFRWLEGDAYGGIRSCNLLLQDLPESFIETPVEGKLNPSFRKEFLMATGWLPQYLDNRSRYEPLPDHALDRFNNTQFNNTNDPDKINNRKPKFLSARQWAYAAWHAQKESIMWTLHETETERAKSNISGSKQLETNRFSSIHIMLFLSATHRHQRGSSAAARLGDVTGGFGFGSGTGRGVSITWVPENITALDEWAYDRREKRESPLFKPGQSKDIAGRLIEAWRDQLMKEIRQR
jgi:hypothetical protein